jgi:hypothetical protein
MKRRPVFPDKGGPGKMPAQQFFPPYIDLTCRIVGADDVPNTRTRRTHERRKAVKLGSSGCKIRTRRTLWTS